MKERIIEALREYILADRDLRNNPASWRSVHPPSDSPQGELYAQ
jgi:hypothetical protein